MKTIICPLFVFINGKKYIINLNNYHTWHHHVRNKIKKAYVAAIMYQLGGTKFQTPIGLNLKYFKSSRRKCDRANIYSLHEKFFCDALTQLGCIADDSDEYIAYSKTEKVVYDKENGRVEITIEEGVE